MTVVVSIHDVHSSTFRACRRLLEVVGDFGLPATLLAIAGPYRGCWLDDRATIDWMHDAVSAGHEVSLHGWTHSTPRGDGGRLRRVGNRVLARGCGEFHQASYDEAYARIHSGLSTLRGLGFDPVGFTPPGWLASRATIDALHDLRLSYVTSHLAVLNLDTGWAHRIPATSQRPRSPLSGTVARAVHQFGAAVLARGHDLRIALHPADLTDDRLISSTVALLALAAEHEALTYRQLVGVPERTL